MPENPGPATDGGLVVGQQITFTGLTARAELNGTQGILKSLDASTGRWTVTLGSGSTVGARLDHLQAVTFAEGQRVTLGGLTGRAELNGALGTLGRKDLGTGRWTVTLPSHGESVNVRVANLRVAPCESGLELTGSTKVAKDAAARGPRTGQSPAGQVRKAIGKGKFVARAKAQANKSSNKSQDPASSHRPLARTAPLEKIKKPTTKPGVVPKKPKRALSAWMLFCNKNRQQVIGELRLKYGTVELADIASELGERWRDLEDKDKKKFERMAAKRKQTQQAKMQAYQEAVDPLGALKRKYQHLIPKRPTTPYFLYIADETQRLRAAEELRKNKRQKAEGEDEAGLNAKLAEMWKASADEEKQPYVLQYEKEKTEFEKKNNIWQQSKEFREVDKLEREHKDAERAERQAHKEAEDAEIQALLKEGVVPGQGLKEGRRAVISGLTTHEELNGKEALLLEWNEESGRWRVQLSGGDDEQKLNLRPANLILFRLQKEALKAEKKEQERAEKRVQKEADLAEKAMARKEAEELKKAEKQQQKEAERTAKESEKEAERAAKAEKQKQKEAERTAKELEKEAERVAKAAAKEAENAKKQAAKLEQKEAERAAKAAEKEAENTAKQAAKLEQKEAERAAKAAEKEAARAAREAAMETMNAALEAAKQEQKAAASAAKVAAKEAARAVKEAMRNAEDFDKEAMKNAEDLD